MAGIPRVMVYIKEGNTVEHDSTATLVCNYTKSSSDTLARLGWTQGEEFPTSNNMADFFLYRDPTDTPHHPIK